MVGGSGKMVVTVENSLGSMLKKGKKEVPKKFCILRFSKSITKV
jgi:RNase P/RNase MRP subunit p29